MTYSTKASLYFVNYCKPPEVDKNLSKILYNSFLQGQLLKCLYNKYANTTQSGIYMVPMLPAGHGAQAGAQLLNDLAHLT